MKMKKLWPNGGEGIPFSLLIQQCDVSVNELYFYAISLKGATSMYVTSNYCQLGPNACGTWQAIIADQYNFLKLTITEFRNVNESWKNPKTAW